MQVALARDHASMQSVRKSSLQLDDAEAETACPADQPTHTSSQPRPSPQDLAAGVAGAGAAQAAQSPDLAEPQLHVVQQSQAFQVQHCLQANLLLAIRHGMQLPQNGAASIS